MDDEEYGDGGSSNGGQYSGFLAAAAGLENEERPANLNKKRKREIDNLEKSAEFESKPRKTHPEWSSGVAGRMPIKLPDGTLQANAARPKQPRRDDVVEETPANNENYEENKDSDTSFDAEEDDDELSHKSASAVPSAPPDVTTFRALSALPLAVVAERRTRKKALVAEYSQRLVADPEHNISAASSRAVTSAASRNGRRYATPATLKRNSLLSLHGLASDPDPAVRKAALVSLTAVFRDILPGYRIRPPSAAEASSAVSKDVKKLRDHESALLTGYQRFLRLCEHTVRQGEGAMRKAAKMEADGVGAGSGSWQGDDASSIGLGGVGGGFEEDVQQDGTAWDEEKEKGKKGGIGQKSYVAAKMAEKRSARAARDGLTSYDADLETASVLGRVALSCMGSLLEGLTHFNFRANLAAFIVPRMSSMDEDAADIACHAVSSAFANDPSFECALEIVRALAEEAKVSTSGRAKGKGTGWGKPTLRAKALQTLLKLPLTDLETLDALNRDSRVNKKEAKAAAKRARKGAGEGGEGADQMADVMAGLKAADGEALTERKTHAKSTLKRVISIYFRILRAPSHSHLLPHALAGLARFAHLIDTAIVSDLLASLRDTLAESGGGQSDDEGEGAGAGGGSEGGKVHGRVRLSLPSALNSVLTALRIMAGPGSVLNADDTAFAHFLYSTLLRVAGPGGGEHALTAAFAVQALLVNRVEYSPDRVAAYVKRCLTLALHVPVPACLALLSVMRSIGHKHAHVRTMWASNTNGVGTGAAAGAGGASRADVTLGVAGENKGAVHDPDRAGLALLLTGWEISSLMSHWHPAVRAAALACAQGERLMPSDNPALLAKAYDESTGLFNPPIPLPTQHQQGHAKGSARAKMKFAYDKPVAGSLVAMSTTLAEALAAANGATVSSASVCATAPGLTSLLHAKVDRLVRRSEEVLGKVRKGMPGVGVGRYTQQSPR